jgi:exoribonuclease-2
MFPMLPEDLSTDMTSLVQGEDRFAIVIELHIQNSGEVTCHEVYPAWVQNRAKLAYSSTGAWLEGRGPAPPELATLPDLGDQLRLQKETSEQLRNLRHQHGALTFGSFEARAVVENGDVKDLVINRHSVAEDIIESFMVAANVAMAQHLKEKRSLSIRRVVRTPRRWDRIQAIALQFGVSLPPIPEPRALSHFLEQRKAADPEHFPDLSLSIVKLLGPENILSSRLDRNRRATSAWRSTITRTRPRRTAVTRTWSRSGCSKRPQRISPRHIPSRTCARSPPIVPNERMRPGKWNG